PTDLRLRPRLVTIDKAVCFERARLQSCHKIEKKKNWALAPEGIFALQQNWLRDSLELHPPFHRLARPSESQAGKLPFPAPFGCHRLSIFPAHLRGAFFIAAWNREPQRICLAGNGHRLSVQILLRPIPALAHDGI